MAVVARHHPVRWGLVGAGAACPGPAKAAGPGPEACIAAVSNRAEPALRCPSQTRKTVWKLVVLAYYLSICVVRTTEGLLFLLCMEN